jgi:hypothetical protein
LLIFCLAMRRSSFLFFKRVGSFIA